MKKSCAKRLRNEKKAVHLQPKTTMVPWMSGLVNGLQNRLQQFESARHLTKEGIASQHDDAVPSSFSRFPPGWAMGNAQRAMDYSFKISGKQMPALLTLQPSGAQRPIITSCGSVSVKWTHHQSIRAGHPMDSSVPFTANRTFVS